MAVVYGWINIYKSGVYHTTGKPGAYDRHGGDVYGTYDAAILAIEPKSHYLDTLPVVWLEPEMPPVNELSK